VTFSIDWGNPSFIGVRATGRLSWSDYTRFEQDFIRELVRRGGYSPLLLDVRGWRGWTAGGFIRDLMFNARHFSNFPRIAVIGDRPWHKWLTVAAKPIFIARMRYFDAAVERQAADWVGWN
jgi:hypothetical protein